MAISHCYSHLVVKNGNFTLLLTSSGQIWQMNLLQPMDPPYKSKDALNTIAQNLTDEPMLADGTPNVAEQRCLHPATDISWSRMAISHCYWYLVVKNGNFTLLLTSSDQIWQMNLLQPMDPHTRAEMPWIPVHKTWQMNLCWLRGPLVPEQTCLAYQYTQLGRWTYIGQWIPHQT